MKVVYVAGALIADDHYKIRLNIDRAAAVGLEVAKLGAYPLIPHTNTGAWFIGTLTPEFWYAATLEAMRRCDAIVLAPGWETSKGTKAEIEEAKRLSMPVFMSINDLRIWLTHDEHIEKPTADDDGREAIKLRVRKKLGPNSFLGVNHQYPDAPYYVGVQEHQEWKWFGAGKTYEEALANAKKVKAQRADRSFIYEEG